MSVWRVSDPKGRITLFSDEALRDAVARGAMPSDRLVWREGMATWEPIENHFTFTRRSGGPLARLFRGLALLFTGLLFLAALAFSLFVLGGDPVSTIPAAVFGSVWLGASAILGVASALLILVWWSLSGRWAMEARGLARIMIVLVGTCGAVLATFQISQTEAVMRGVAAVEPMRNYSFVSDPKTGTLRIEGNIGPGFATTMQARLKDPAIERVVINSPGGLLDEAVRAARMLEGRGGMTVAAHQLCASACLVVLMGGERRVADYDMTLDFHASSPTVEPGRDLDRYLLKQGSEEARAYLIKRGAPEPFVKEADRLGAKHIYRLPAVLLVEPGMLTGLVDERGVSISPADAKARLQREHPGLVLAPVALALDKLDLNPDADAP